MTEKTYYRSNAICEKLTEENLIPPFFFGGPHVWHVVYGDAEGRPIMVLLVTAGHEENIETAPTEIERRSLSVLSVVAERPGLPLFHLRFGYRVHEIDSVGWRAASSEGFAILSLEELADVYRQVGLPVREGSSAKAVNDKTSSAYHNWQRAALGSDIIASDIDLWWLGSNGTPEIAFELKRSHMPVESWEPFRADYANFRLLSNILRPAGISFYIAYNQKADDFDDPSTIALFRVDFARQPPIGASEVIGFSEFASREYS